MVWPPVLCDPSRHSVHSFKKWCGHWVLFNYGEKDERIRSPLPTNHPNFQIIFFGWNISFFGGLCNCKNAVLSPPTLVLSKPNSTCLLGMWVTTPKALVNHWWPISKGPSKVVPDCFPHIPIKRHQQVLSFTKWGIHRFVFPQRFWRVTLGPYMTLTIFYPCFMVSWELSTRRRSSSMRNGQIPWSFLGSPGRDPWGFLLRDIWDINRYHMLTQ